MKPKRINVPEVVKEFERLKKKFGEAENKE